MAATVTGPWELTPPEPVSEDLPGISFCHPGYASLNILITLPRVDRAGPGTEFGVHHRTALLACQIIANNAFDGFLSLDRAGTQRVNMSPEEVLTGDSYYFIVPKRPERYAITPSFNDWQFPHQHFLGLWPAVNTTFGSSCSITGRSHPIDMAHLIPQTEKNWLVRNNFTRYNNWAVVHPQANLLALRPDLHRCFDDRHFAIVPKSEGDSRPHAYVIHNITDDCYEYHNAIVRGLDRKSRPFLLARFAWTILIGVKGFVTSGIPRQVVCLHDDEQGNIEWITEELSGPDLRARYGGGGSLQSRAIKRRRTDSATEKESEESEVEPFFAGVDLMEPNEEVVAKVTEWRSSLS